MAPAARAIALLAAIAVAAAAADPRLRLRAPRTAHARHAGHPRCRDRTAAARLRAADPARGRTGQTECAGRHHQRPLVQRFRHRRPPHLRQRRRAVGCQDAERNHRRVRARDRTHCRRASAAPARSSWRPRNHAVDHRDDRWAWAPWSPPSAAAAPAGQVGAAAIAGPNRRSRTRCSATCARRKTRPTAPASSF